MGPLTRLRSLLLLPALALAACADRPAHHDDLEKFQGTWYSVATESDQRQQTGEDRGDLHVIEGSHCVVKFGGATVGESEITLEPGQPFGKITFVMTAGPSQGRTWIGIYEATADTLQWNGGWQGEVTAVPTRFATAEGDHYFLRRVGRVRP